MGEMRNAYKIFVGNVEEKRPLGISKLRWERNTLGTLKNRVGVFGLDSCGSG
jgi:hypothetical protein